MSKSPVASVAAPACAQLATSGLKPGASGVRTAAAWNALAAILTAMALTGCEPIVETTDWDAPDADAVGYDEWAPDFYGDGTFRGWDADGDFLLSEDEWRVGFERDFGAFEDERWGAYQDWDEDRSGLLSEPEFASGVFDTYDLDDDTILGGDELGAFTQDWD